MAKREYDEDDGPPDTGLALDVAAWRCRRRPVGLAGLDRREIPSPAAGLLSAILAALRRASLRGAEGGRYA